MCILPPGGPKAGSECVPLASVCCGAALSRERVCGQQPKLFYESMTDCLAGDKRLSGQLEGGEWFCARKTGCDWLSGSEAIGRTANWEVGKPAGDGSLLERQAAIGCLAADKSLSGQSGGRESSMEWFHAR